MSNVPFGLDVLKTMYPRTKHINEKARRLEAQGEIIRLKKGLYVVSPDASQNSICRNLVANHIYGPSYVSMQTALRHYGLIPERVNIMQSVTTKHARSFENALGYFDYQNCSKEYFPIGIRMEKEKDVVYMIASPEKALCDLVNFSKGVSLRFMKDVAVYFEEDIRLDMDAVPFFDISVFENCALYSRKSQNISTIIKYIRRERYL